MHFVKVKNIITGANNGINVYRGCVHGCVYCDTRSKCYGFNHALEDIEVKENAVELLDDALKRKKQKCMIGTGSMADPYQPCENELFITRKCLEVILERNCGATMITKSDLVLRDLDLLKEINRRTKCAVQITLTCTDDKLSKIIEPNVCTTNVRIKVLEILKQNNIPTVVWLCPVLPFITDSEQNIKNILEACVANDVKGIICFGMGMTLRDGNREYFYSFLDKFNPDLKQKYINLYGNRYNIQSPNSANLMRLYNDTCSKYNIISEPEDVFAYLKDFPQKQKQLSLF
ncbi:MAG: radical SAM protein [Bacteroidales bacterium]|nr:radical SAM protein [Bacteroidales bacterium]